MKGEQVNFGSYIVQLNAGQLSQLLVNVASVDDEGASKQLPDCIPSENGLVLTDLGRLQVSFRMPIFFNIFILRIIMIFGMHRFLFYRSSMVFADLKSNIKETQSFSLSGATKMLFWFDCCFGSQPLLMQE